MVVIDSFVASEGFGLGMTVWFLTWGFNRLYLTIKGMVT